MNRPLIDFLLLVALGSATPILIGHLLARWGGRRGHGFGLALVVLASLAIALVELLGRAPDVPVSRALTGASIAALLLGLLPLSLCFELGYRFPWRLVLVGLWLLSLIPIAVYVLFMGLWVYGFVDCTTTEAAQGCGTLIGG